MKKLIAGIIFTLSLSFSFLLPINKQKGVEIDNPELAKPGMVAYAASYASDPTNEPQYSTQNNKTFQYLNLGHTLEHYRGDSVKVGIIDSGINYDHEDFVVSGSTRVKGDSKYYEYQTSSWVYYKASQHGYSYIDDTLGHGTNVAATVAAAVNSIGGTGLAPNVELYVYKVTNSNNGYEFGAIQNALMDAKTLGLDVINMSFQSYEHAVSYNGSSMGASSGCSTILSYYLNQAYNAGITLVGAAGNYNTSEPSYPGSNSHVINVGSLNQTGTDKAGFSNYGSTIDLVAPGYVHVADKGTNSSYKDTSGTSFSAPLVTAAIALYKQKNPSATPAQIETALYASCDPIDSGSTYSNWAGNGALNVAKFLGVEGENCPTDIVINNPEIVNEELELEVGDTFDLDWTVNGNGTFNHSVTFSTYSGNNDVVSVNSSGRITAVGAGSDIVTITSVADSSVSADVYMTVTSSGSTPTVSSVTVSPASLSLDLNGTTTGNLTVTVNGTNNPSQSVTWTSSNTNIATVSASGVVTAEATGTATITATSQQDSTKSGTCTVIVSDTTVHVTGVTLNKDSTSIAVGDDETLTAAVAPSNATNKDVAWTSSDTNVATVDGGKVTGVAVGSATITVTTADGGKIATCLVTVTTPVQPQTLTITRSSFASSGNYAWYTWTQNTSDSVTISGKAELYTTETGSMQFNKNKGNNVAAIYNSTAIPGSITKIEATSLKTTIRSWTAYVTSTACSGSGSTLTFGSNKTAVGTVSPAVGTSTSFGTSNAGYSYFCIQENDSSASFISEFKITYTPKSLSSIAVKTAPTKTTYEAGETFDPTGLVITAAYSDASTNDISYTNDGGFTFSPSTSTALTTANTSVIITYGGQSTSQAITVSAVKTLSSISISGYTTSFVEGDTFSFGGTVTAHYSDSSTDNVTSSSTFTGYNMTIPDNYTVTVSYTYKGTAKTQTYGITVSAGTLSSIAVTDMTTEYVKNGSFSFDGTCTATFANGYQKVVTPTSVSSPDMTTGGNKTVTVSYTYNGNTVTTDYSITVSAYRTVMEEVYSTIGSVTYTSGSEVISTATLSTSKSGYTNLENGPDTSHKAIRLGSGSATGTITVTSTTSNISRVVVNTRVYNTDSDVSLSIGGASYSITTTYTNYTKDYTTATNSVSISTSAKSKRVWISTITVYSKSVQDIGKTEDCVGLETFINNYMHMDYTENLGYCSDSTHHYYATAKAAFNVLNDHQRKLFTTNSAYLVEWTRLSTWASKNGDILNASNILGATTRPIGIAATKLNSSIIVVVVIGTIISVTVIGGYFFLRKRKED